MTNRINGGKRSQAQRASEAVKGLVGNAESEIGRHRAELERLIAAGKVEPLFAATNLRRRVFEGWLSVKQERRPISAFVALCRAWYLDMNPEGEGRSRPDEGVDHVKAFLDGCLRKPSRAEIDAAVERGELTREDGILAFHTWELRQRTFRIAAQEELAAREKLEEVMSQLDTFIRPGKIGRVREIVAREIIR